MHPEIQCCHTHTNALLPFKGITDGFQVFFQRRQSVLDAAELCAEGVPGRDDAEDHQHGGDERRPLLHKASHSTTHFPTPHRASAEGVLQAYSQQPSSTSRKDSRASTVAEKEGGIEASRFHGCTTC